MRKSNLKIKDVADLFQNSEANIYLMGQSSCRRRTVEIMQTPKANVTELEGPLEGIITMGNSLDLVVIPLSETGSVEVHFAHLVREIHSPDCPIVFVGKDQNDVILNAKINNISYIDTSDWECLKNYLIVEDS